MESNKITYIIFGSTLVIVLLNLLSLIFPALLISINIGSQSQTNPFEVGAWLVPLVSINIFILFFGVLYYKRILPKKIKNSFHFILDFEVSKKVSLIIFSIIISGYIIFTANELTLNELDVFKDWIYIQKVLDNYPYGVNQEGSEELEILHVKNFLLFLSQEVFQNVKVIPFFASICLISLTYFFTVKISNKRFSGLISMIILIQSGTFLRYDTSATFSNFWSLFYILSLYLIYKRWVFSPLLFIASIFSKPLTILFLPMTFLITLRSRLPRKTIVGTTISYALIIVVMIAVLFLNVESGYSKNLTNFNNVDFWSSFSTWAFQLRIDGLVLLFLFPLTVGLFLKSRQGHQSSESMLILLGGILLSAPLLAAFTEYNIQPYRWVPLITFFAIGVGTLLSKFSVERSED